MLIRPINQVISFLPFNGETRRPRLWPVFQQGEKRKLLLPVGGLVSERRSEFARS